MSESPKQVEAASEKTPTPPPIEKTVVTREEPQAKKYTGRKTFGIPSSLDKVSIGKTESSKEEEAEVESISVDDNISIDKAIFDSSLKILVKKVLGADKKLLASILNSSEWQLEYNRWILQVENDVSRKVVDEERWIVTEMRSLVNQPKLILDLRVKEITSSETTEKPLTNTQRLEKMKEKNPNLNDLIQRFDTMLNY